MTTFKVGDGTEEAVLFVTLPLVVPDWFRVAFMGALREMTIEDNWFVEGDSTANFARDKAVEMINGIEFSEVNPLPMYTPPVGSIQMFGGTTPPDGWLSCDHSSLLRADYPDLFAVIGTNFGAIDADHFYLPDFKTRFPVGIGTVGLYDYSVGTQGGNNTVQLTEATMPAHTHTGVVSPNNPLSNRALVSTGGAQTVRPAGTSDSTGGDLPHENRPPFTAVMMIIYAGL